MCLQFMGRREVTSISDGQMSAVLMAAWILTCLLYLTLPPSADQIAHAYLGWRVVEGDVPYREVIDMNWPGVMTLHAVAIWIFGLELWSWRAMDFALFAMTAICLSDIVRLVAGKRAGLVCLVLAPVIYVGAMSGVAGQHDMTAGQFLVAAMWCQVRGFNRRSLLWPLGSGLLLGVAIVNKPTVGTLALLIPAQSLWHGAGLIRTAGRSFVLGVGILLSIGVFAWLLMHLGTTWDELLDSIYTYNLHAQYADSKSLAQLLHPRNSVTFCLALIASIPATIWLMASPQRSIASTALPILWVVGLISFLVQRKGFAYHLSPSFLAMIGAVSMSVVLVADGRAFGSWSALSGTKRIALAAMLLAGIGAGVVRAYDGLIPAAITGEYSRYYARFHSGGNMSVADAVGLISEIGLLSSEDCAFVVGASLLVNLQTRRPQPTAFYIPAILASANAPMPMASRWRARWREDIENLRCTYVLVAARDAKWLESEDSSARLLAAKLDNNYRAIRRVGSSDVVLYQRLIGP